MLKKSKGMIEAEISQAMIMFEKVYGAGLRSRPAPVRV